MLLGMSLAWAAALVVTIAAGGACPMNSDQCEAAPAGGAQSAVTVGAPRGRTGQTMGGATLLQEEGDGEEAEAISLGQLGPALVLSASGLKSFFEKEALQEVPEEELLSPSDAEDLRESLQQKPEVAQLVVTSPLAPSAPGQPAVEILSATAARGRLAAEKSPAPSAFGALLAVSLAMMVGSLCRAPFWHKASGRLAASKVEDIDPLSNDSPPLTAEECVRYCRGRQPRRARPKPAADAWGCTLLHVAAKEGAACEVRRLLLEGADANATEAWEQTPLHFAAQAGSVDASEALLAVGASVNVLNASDRTPLVEAAAAGHEAVCRLLLEHGGHAGGLPEAELPPLLSAVFVSGLVTGPALAEPAAAATATESPVREAGDEDDDGDDEAVPSKS